MRATSVARVAQPLLLLALMTLCMLATHAHASEQAQQAQPTQRRSGIWDLLPERLGLLTSSTTGRTASTSGAAASGSVSAGRDGRPGGWFNRLTQQDVPSGGGGGGGDSSRSSRAGSSALSERLLQGRDAVTERIRDAIAPQATDVDITAVCAGKPDGLQPHPQLCTKYVMCSRGATYEFDCARCNVLLRSDRCLGSQRLFYDTKRQYCNW